MKQKPWKYAFRCCSLCRKIDEYPKVKKIKEGKNLAFYFLCVMSVYFLPYGLTQGPLNTYMDRTPILSNKSSGDSNLHSFTDTQYFLDIFHVFVEKFSKLRALLFLSSTQTSQNLKFIQKCPRLSDLKKSSSELKTNFDPSLERSWYELFGIIKAHGPKNQPPYSPGVW